MHCYQGDVSSLADMRKVVAVIREDLGRIDCVMHAAGIAGDGFILRKDPDTFHQTLAPKVLGATVLDTVTADDPPELMVLFGSTTAIFGAAGQSDYTAANMFLDGFAEYRNVQGRRTVSIDWTDWLGTGMAFDHAVQRDQGFFKSIAVDEAIASLEEILNSWCTRVIVGEINYPMLASVDPETLAARLSRAPLVLAESIHQGYGRGRGPTTPR